MIIVPEPAKGMAFSRQAQIAADEARIFKDSCCFRPATPKAGRLPYAQLLQSAQALFEKDALADLLENGSAKDLATNAAGRGTKAGTEPLALDWLRQGGKQLRPFIALGAFSAVSNGLATIWAGDHNFPRSVRQVAAAMEALHKASLVHDDIEDDDSYRYGRETLHRREGIPAAINVGDYLIGLGYSLICAAAEELGPSCAQDLLSRLARAHLDLSRGQGAELLLRSKDPEAVTSAEMERIYVLKTSPPFDAAIYAGIRMACPKKVPLAGIRRFSENLGVGYQVLNDLKDWNPDDYDKVVAGQDLLSGRPTVLSALAWESCNEAARLVSACRARPSRSESNRSSCPSRIHALSGRLGAIDESCQRSWRS